MSTHTGSVTRPRFESSPYRIHPSRREFIFGKVEGLPDIRRSKVITAIAKVLRGAGV